MVVGGAAVAYYGSWAAEALLWGSATTAEAEAVYDVRGSSLFRETNTSSFRATVDFAGAVMVRDESRAPWAAEASSSD